MRQCALQIYGRIMHLGPGSFCPRHHILLTSVMFINLSMATSIILLNNVIETLTHAGDPRWNVIALKEVKMGLEDQRTPQTLTPSPLNLSTYSLISSTLRKECGQKSDCSMSPEALASFKHQGRGHHTHRHNSYSKALKPHSKHYNISTLRCAYYIKCTA